MKKFIKLIRFAQITFETLTETSQDLAAVIKIVTVVVNALNQQGFTLDGGARGMEPEALNPHEQALCNDILGKIHDAAE